MSSLLDLIKAKRADIAANSGDRLKTIKPTDGTSRFRVLPSWRGEGQQFWHDFGQHFVKNNLGKIAAIYVCTEKTYGKECPVCAAVEQGMSASPDDVTTAILKEAKSGNRNLVNVLHIDGPKPNEVQILELSPTAFGAFLTIMEQYDEAEQSIFDAETGRDVIITRTGSGLQTKYAVMAAVKSTPIPAGVMAKLHDLDKYVAQESPAQQLRALSSIRAVSGLLPAPAAYRGLPAAAAGAATLEEDPYAVAPPPVKAVKAELPWEDAAVKAPAKPVKPVVAAILAAATIATVEGTGDSELDDLLATLG